jgi:hypothetical protein
MKTKISLLLLGLGLVFTLGCTKYPPSSERLLEDLVVVTQYDTKVNFNNYKTYSIVSAVTEITDRDTSLLTGSTAMAALDQIEKNMQARGFTKAAAGTKADFGIDVLYFENTTVYTYYYDYWGYYPYYGYYYPYYPVYYSSYTTGMANIELIDLKYVNDAGKQVYLRWNAYIRGLLTGGHTTSEITQSIDQAFAQTPQLATSAK